MNADQTTREAATWLTALAQPRFTARRVFHSWPAFLTRYYIRETYRTLPGPWPVKVAITVACVAIPGPLDELAVIGLAALLRARKVAQS